METPVRPPALPPLFKYKRSPRKRIRTQNVLVVGPRLSQLQPITELGRNIDLLGLARAVIGVLADRQMKEIDNADQGRTMVLAECARLWTGIAERMGAMAPETAKPLELSAARSGTPMPFQLDRFERRKEGKDPQS